MVRAGLRLGMDDHGAGPQLLGAARAAVIAAARFIPGVCAC
jgi:hypothetical protein